MTAIANTLNTISHYRQHDEMLPLSQLRRLGLIYNSYRLLVNVVYLILAYASASADSASLLPNLLQHTALLLYLLLSVVLLAVFYVVRQYPQRQLGFGLIVDIIILSVMLYSSGMPDLQLTLLYMVVVAASFMLLQGSQALVITLLAIIFVIYQQFFYAISNTMSLTNLGDALLMSVSFLVVGFLSWTVSRRLLHVEHLSAQQAKEVERLNDINQEVISQMADGVIVLNQQQIILANHAAYQLLDISAAEHDNKDVSYFWQQLANLHNQLLSNCLATPIGQSNSFIYKLPATIHASAVSRLRVQLTPLKDNSRLIILENLRREQANAQQLKLASLGQLTASIAHEIRNPLAAISQASQLLIEEANSNINTKKSSVHSADNDATNLIDDSNHELYKMIFLQTKRVNRIIEDILKLSKQQSPQKQYIALGSWMPKFINNYFSDKNVCLSNSVQTPIFFDAHQLEQVLINLINNSLHYSSLSQPHTCVEIESYDQGNDVIIDILDNGAGVKPADIEHLFDPFFTTDKAGTGLGLYLSQVFMEANQARLVYVAEHKKTCFRLIIPTSNR